MGYERIDTPETASVHPTNAGPAGSKIDDEFSGRIVQDLRKLSLTVLEEALNKLFTGADDALFEQARKAGNNREQSECLDAMRTIRLGRSGIQRRFLQEIGHGFVADVTHRHKPEGAALDFESLTLTDSIEIEKTIAITNIAERANGLYQDRLWDIGRRFNTLTGVYRVSISPEAMSPFTICEAFRIAVEGENLELRQALAIYQLFDRFVIAELGTLYAMAVRVFDLHSVRPEKIAVVNRAPAVSAAPPASEHPPAGAVIAEQLPATELPLPANLQSLAALLSAPMEPLPERTLQMLQQIGVPNAIAGSAQAYTDQHLAEDLIGASLGRVVPGWDQAHARAYVRRTDAIGQMFNAITDDPNMPGELKSRFEALRFEVVKTALQDVNFFSNPQHPVRGLVNELATVAASARAASIDTLQRVDDLVGRIQDQFRVAADSVRHPKIDPLENIAIQGFLADQAGKSQQRRQAVIDKVRRVVAEELRLRTAGHNVPATAQRLFRSGWAPMMASHLLRHGLDSQPWQEGMGLLNETLNALDPSAPPPVGGITGLVAAIDARLADVGMPVSRRKELLDALVPALLKTEVTRRPAPAPLEPSAPPVEAAPTPECTKVPPPASPAPKAAAKASGISREAVLEAIVVPGSWFRILDAKTKQNHWLRAVTYYPGRSSVSFTEFNGRNQVSVNFDKFFDGLVNNRIEPLELLPVAKDVLDRFLAQDQPEPV